MRRDATRAQLLRKLKRRCNDAIAEALSSLDREALEYVLSAPTDLGAMMRAVAEYVVLIDASRKLPSASKPSNRKARRREPK